MGVAGLEQFLADRSADTERQLRTQYQALSNAQREHRNVPVCWEAMQVETALACVLARQPELRARSGYELASDYVKRYEPTAFGALNRASVEPLVEVTRFWHGYADGLGAAGRGDR